MSSKVKTNILGTHALAFAAATLLVASCSTDYQPLESRAPVVREGGSGTRKVVDPAALKKEPQNVATVTKTALAQATAKAAEQVAQEPPLQVSCVAHLRDLAASAARVFG